MRILTLSSLVVVGIFAIAMMSYQISYGVSKTIHGPNGISGTVTAPPGSKIENFKFENENITQDNNNSYFLGNSSWMIHNITSGSVGIITFKEIDVHYIHGDWSYSMPGVYSYTRILDGKIDKGTADGGFIKSGAFLILCPNSNPELHGPKNCSHLWPTKITHNYVEFSNDHGPRIWPPHPTHWSISLTRIDNSNQYLSGYKHGLNDPDLKEILKDINHTKAFNQGYIDGWCSLPGNGPYSGSDADQETFECQYDASEYNNSTADDASQFKGK